MVLFSFGSGQQQINDNKKCRQIAGNFDCQYNTRRIARWSTYRATLEATGCCHRVSACAAPAAAMVDEFVEITHNTNKTQLLAGNYGTLRSLAVYENFNPKTDPLLSSLMRQAA
jgi:hypothetical protein